jgi:hypothetical protein
VRPLFALGAVLEPLLERFVSDHEAESLRRGGFLCPLQMENPEGDGVRTDFVQPSSSVVKWS